ncbi:MAG: HAMP domain-containing sensor histidine kinase [Actinomycetes bacterium]
MSLRTRVALITLVIAVSATIVVSALAVEITSTMLTKAADNAVLRVANIPRLSQRLTQANGPRAVRAVVPADTSVQVDKAGDAPVLLWGDQSVPVPEWAISAVGSGPVFFDATVDSTPYRAVAKTDSDGSLVVVSKDMSVAQAVIDDLVRRLILVGAVVALVAGAVGWFAASAVVRPLRRLTGAAEHVATTGELSLSVRSSAGDETGRLSRAFDDMLGALATSQALQRQLVQDAGHELRTPITSIMSNAQVLRRHGDLDAGTRDRICDDIFGESQELARLVDSLVALAGVMDDQEPVAAADVMDLVDAATRRLPAAVADRIVVAEPGTDRGVTDSVGDASSLASAGAAESTVWVRSAQVQRALVNLLTNAAKFDTGSQGSAVGPIEVTITPGEAAISIEVRDHGPGIAPADLPHVFDRFYRADTAQLVPGSGLGLSIVADICRHNNGTVTVVNDPAGGAVATLTFPRPVG